MAVLGKILIPSLLYKISKSSRKKITMQNIAPKGSFFVYVSEECKKYVVPITLSSSLNFKALFEKYEEGIQAMGPITLPSCTTSEFEAILKARRSCWDDDDFEKIGLLYDQD